MKPHIVDVPAITVVGYEMSGTQEEIEAMRPEWTARFLKAAGAIPAQTDGQLMDICLKRAGQLYTHCIAIEVDHIDIIPSGMSSLTIPAGSYASFEITGESGDIKQGFRSILLWAREHKIRLDTNEFKMDVTVANGHHQLYWRLADKRSEPIEEAV